VVFGPFLSMRHFWEYMLGGVAITRPFYIHWKWLRQVPDVATPAMRLAIYP
jgi:hypothetical protein